MEEKADDGPRFAPLTKDFVCQHQTLFNNQGIEMGGGMAIGFMPLSLSERYRSFAKRLALKLNPPPTR